VTYGNRVGNFEAYCKRHGYLKAEQIQFDAKNVPRCDVRNLFNYPCGIVVREKPQPSRVNLRIKHKATGYNKPLNI
jgi:hypothetical protein